MCRGICGVVRRFLQNNFYRAVAILVVNCFIVSFVLEQGVTALLDEQRETGQVAKELINDLCIPGAVGRVTEARYFGSPQTVIVIQDLHCHPEVQRNIAKMLSSLERKYVFKAVYLEGAAGPVDTSWLSCIRDEKVRNGLVESLVDQGKLTGAEYYSVKAGKPFIIQGMEDKELHTGNLKRLGKILEDKDGIEADLQAVEGAVQQLKRNYYNKKQTKLDELVSDHRNGKLETRRYYAFLKKYSDTLGVDIYGYRDIAVYLSLVEQEKKLDYRKIAVEMQRFIALFRQRLPYNEYAKLLESTRDRQNMDQMYRTIERFADACHLKGTLVAQFPALARFFDYLALSREINPVLLLKEENRLVRDLEMKLADNESEKDIAFAVDYCRNLREYYTNKIAADDYGYFSENARRFAALWTIYSDNGALARLNARKALFDEFYRVNLERNHCFINNILGVKRIEPSSGNAIVSIQENIEKLLAGLGSNDIKVVVSGGFHTDGISELLAKAGISYLVLTPNVTQDTSFASEVYAKLAAEQSRILSQTLALQALSQQPNSDKAKAAAEAILAAYAELSKEMSKAEIVQSIQALYADLKAKDEKANKIIVPVSFTLEETNGIPSVKIRYGDKEEEYLSREGEIVDSVSGNDEKNNDSKAKKSLKEQMKKAFSIVVATIGFNLLLIRSANAQTFDFSYIQNINPLILLIGGVIVFGIVANLAKGATKIFAKRQVINTLKSNNVMKLLKLSKDNSVEKDAVINALASIGLPAIPVLINNLKGDYYSISYSALKKIGLPAVPSLIAEIEREDSEISFYRIFSILQHINPTDDTTMAAIRQLIAHKDKYIAQMAAKYYISVRGIPEAKIENLELLKELKKSEDVRVDENILRIDAPVVEPLLDALSQNVSREVRVRSIVAAKAAIDTSLAEEKREGAIQIIVDAGLTLVVKNIHITNVLEYGVPSAVQISKGDIELFRKHIKALEVLVDHSNSDDKVSIEDIVKANELKLDMPIVAPLVNALEQKKWVTDVLVTQAIPKSVIAFENYFNEDFREQAMKMVAAMGLNLVNAGILCCSTIEYGVPLAAQASKGDIKQFGENIGHLAGFARYLNSKGDINPFLSLKTVNDIDIINNIRNPEEFESALYIGDGLVEFEHKNTFGEKVIMDNMIAALSSNIATFKGVLGIENSFIVTRESVFKGTRIVSIGLSKHEKDTWEEFSTWCYAELKRIHGYSEEDVISVNYEEVYSGNSCSGATTGYDVQFTVQEENTKQIRILVTDRSDWERLSHLSGKELAKELIKLKDELEKHYPDKYIGDRSVNHSSENIKVALGFTRDELIEVVFKYLTRDTVPVSAVEDIRDMAVGIVELLFKNSLRVHAGGVSMLSSGVVQKELNEEKRLFEEALEESAARHGAELARWGFAQDSGRVKVQVAKGDLIPVGDGLSSLGYASTAIVDGDIVVTVTDGFLRNRSGRAPASIYGELAEHEVRELIYLKANPDKSFHDFHRSAEGRAVSENIFAFAQQSIEEHSLVLSIADISSLVTSSIIGNAQKLDAAKEKEEIDALLGTIREYTAGRNDIIIAVDGTSAAGKGTLAGRLAKDLGFYYLDAGSTNRMITWLALRQGVDIDDGAALHNLVKSNIDRFTIDYSNGRLAIWYAGEGERIDITGAIRSPEVNNAVARVSAHREVLEALFALNRKLVKGKNAIADGRNMGADVFKDTAFSKLYLDAELHARAQKRVEAYQRSGKAADLEEVRKSIKDRDDMDRNRPFYPLRKAEDAEYIDSTDRDAAYKAILEAIVDKIMDERRFGNAFNGGRVMEIAKQLSLFKSSLGSIWQDNTWSGNRAMEPVEYILTMIRQAKEHGFTSIEFSTDDPVGHLDNPAYEARSRELIAAAPRIRKEAEDNGIDIVFHAPSFSFKDSKGVSWFPEPFRDAATYERWLDFSAQIGAKLFTLHISDPHSEESLNGIAGFIEEAAKRGITVGVENTHYNLKDKGYRDIREFYADTDLPTYEEFADAMNSIYSKLSPDARNYFGITLDVPKAVHAKDPTNGRNTHPLRYYSELKRLEKKGIRIVNIHLAQTESGKYVKKPIFEKGAVNIQQFLERLEIDDYKGYLYQELEGDIVPPLHKGTRGGGRGMKILDVALQDALRELSGQFRYFTELFSQGGAKEVTDAYLKKFRAEFINRGKLERLVRYSEASEISKVEKIGQEIDALPGRNLVLIAGPSAAGKTPTARRLLNAVKKGKVVTLNLDNYYRDHEDIRRTNGGKLDFDFPEALDLALINEHITALLKGEAVQVPKFDMDKGVRKPGDTTTLQLGQDQVLVIEGVFALHPAISKGLQPAMRLFIKGFPLKLQSGETLSYDDYRLIRRIVRDARTRGISALRTINQWPMVLRGEETHIFPTAANARLLVEPYFPYELPTLKFLIMPMLDEAEKLAGEDPEGNREALSKIAWLRRLLLQVPPVNVNDTPVDADFMEFVGPIDNRAIEKMLGKYSGDKLYSSPGIFIGMPFDPDILESLAKVRNDLKQFNRILELQEPEEMHITVAAKTSSFYDGPADETALKEAESAASDSAARNNAFHASLKGKLQLKPDGAVILEITDERMLQGVRALRDTVAPAWYKPAIVHITLGRLKTLDYDLKDIRAIEQVLEKHNEAGTLNKRITVKSLQYGQHKLKEKATVADAALLKRINLVSDEASDLLGALVMELPVVFDMMNPLNPADIYNPVSQFIPQVATPQTEQRLKDIAHREKIAGKFLPVIAADADIAGVSQYAALGIDAFAVAWGDGGEFLFNLEVPLPGEKEPVKVRVLADNRQLAAGNIAHVLNLQPEGAAALSAERRALILGRGSLALLDKLDRISRIKKDDKTIVKLRELGYDIRGRFELGAVELQGASASLAIPGLVKDAYAEQRLFQTVPFIYKADAKPALFNTGELLPLLYEKFTAASGEGAAVDMNLLGVLAADEAIGIDGFESSYPALSGIVLPRDSGEDTTEEAARYTIETAVIPAIMRRGNGAGSENTVFAEIVPVSALRGKAGAFAAQLRKMGFDAGAVTQVLREDRADPGIGKITDLETYMFRNGITDAQLMPLVQPVADSPFAAFSPMAGDEQLIDWLKVSERFKFKGLTLADVVAPRRTDTVDRNEVNVREFALARKLRLTPRQADEFEAYAAKNAYWLDRYAAARVLGKPVAGVSAAEIEEVRSQRDFDAYRRLQWILSDQLEKALAVIRLRGDHVFFWLDVNKDNYRNLLNAVTEKEGVPVVYPGILAHWFSFGFDGVRLNVKDASILTEEYVQELKNAIKAANPGAFAAKAVFVKLPKGVAPSVVSLLRSEGFSLVENFLERDTLAGTASVDIDSPDDTVRPHRNPAFRQKYGEPGDREFYRRIVADAENLRAPRVFAMLFTYRGDSIPVKTVDPGAQEHFTYRIPREGDVERSRFSIGELLADITGKAGLAIPEKYYDEGYRSGLSYADVPEDLPAKEIYELLSDITETYMHDKQAWLRNSGGNYFDKANRVFSSSHSSWGMRRYIGNLEKFVRLESLSDGDKANYTLQLAGFLRGIVEQAAERHQGKGTRELLSASPDHTVLRSLGSLASVFGTADSRDKQGLPREVEEYLRSSTLPLFETVTAGSGDEAKILSHILAAQRERALSPAETVLLARLLIKRGATPDEVRAAINPLASEIVQYGVFSGMAGNKPAVNAWIISELLGIYNVITDLDAGHLGDTLDDMMKVFNDMAVRSLTSAA